MNRNNSIVLCAFFGVAVLGIGAMAATFEPTPEPTPTPIPTDPPNTMLVFDGLLEEGPFVPEIVLDTSTYVFGAPTPTNFFGGMQDVGTMDKVGVHADVDTAHPSAASDGAVIAADQTARDAFLVTEGVTVPAGIFWQVELWSVKQIGADQHYDVTVAGGNDDDIDVVIREEWKLVANGNPTLVSRVVQDRQPKT